MVGGGECFVDALLGKDQLAHAIVIKCHQRIRQHCKFVEGRFCLFAAAAALEGEGHGGENDDERAFFPCDPGHNRCGSRASSTTETGAEEDNAAAVDRGTDRVFGFEDGLVAELWIPARTKTLGEIHSELNFLGGEAGGKSSGVRIQG